MGTGDVGKCTSCAEISITLTGTQMPVVCGYKGGYDRQLPLTILGHRMASLPCLLLETTSEEIPRPALDY